MDGVVTGTSVDTPFNPRGAKDVNEL